MQMDACAYANEMLIRMDRFLDENLSLIFIFKTTHTFLIWFKEIFFRLKL